MTIVPAGTLLYFDYTAYDIASTLPAGMRIFNMTTGTPVLVATVGMTYVFGGSYLGSYTFPGTASQVYLIHKAVYTDNTYNTIADGPYSPGSETVQVGGFDSRQGNAI